MILNETTQIIQAELSAGRFKHTQGVAQTARELALQFGADPDKAELAGWLHDIAKEYKAQKLLEEARRFNLEIDFIEIKSPQLLHARVGAELARERFGINDDEILDAIRQHTLGKPNMSLLEEILFVADATEPGRPETWAGPIRQILKEKGLRAAILKSCENTIKEVVEKHFLLHPLTVQTYNFYLHA